jgi:hypothetical protein
MFSSWSPVSGTRKEEQGAESDEGSGRRREGRSVFLAFERIDLANIEGELLYFPSLLRK